MSNPDTTAASFGRNADFYEQVMGRCARRLQWLKAEYSMRIKRLVCSTSGRPSGASQ
jgi:hypothetical protein